MSPILDTVLPSGKVANVPLGLFINNEYVPAIGGETFDTYSPMHSTKEKVIASPSAAQPADVDLAVKHARQAFKTTWGRNCVPTERASLLNKLADLMERDIQLLAEIEAFDSGKGVRIVREVDITDAIACLRYYAGWCDKMVGQTIEVNDTQRFAYSRHEPIGVCGQIIPWNYPIGMWSWKVAPALAVGCCVIIKPSELTPLSALKLCELVKEAGYPAGVVQCLPGLGPVAGNAIASHIGIDKVAFTGSTITGRKIMEAAAKSNLKPVTLELGGKSPNLIFESADLEQATNWAMLGTFYNMGQDCTCGSRVYVQASIYDKVVEMMAKKAQLQKIGDSSDEATFHGPLVSKSQFEKVMSYIQKGKDEGARCVVGGERWGDEGYFVKPTIFADVNDEMTIVKEEIFGPVMSVGKFETEAEAIELANNTTYGLAAGVFSTDINQCMRVSSALEAGTVWVNMCNTLANNVPFGGKKQSGIGRELGQYALENYTSVKAVQINYGEQFDWPI